ncbi:MAG: IS30 family transposase [Psychromonas sp.]|nr:IS30 family transposase [Psychromonas sp.]
MNKYTQITLADRYTIYYERKQGKSYSEIADIVGRHRSTIARELKRNKCPSHGYYVVEKADAYARTRRSRSRKKLHYSDGDFKLVRKLLRKKWSPEQIVGYFQFKLVAKCMSHETIYQYIWRDKAQGGNLWTHLRQSPKQRRKRYKGYDSRGRLSDKRNISERPASVETREEKGHWEIDTVHGRGSRHCIVTLLERQTGYVMIGKLPNKTASSLNKKTVMLIRRKPLEFKTITSDNGTEFHQYKKIEERCQTTFYFANPYHSWERGCNEHVNGLIRQYLPKTKSMEMITQRQCDQIAKKLNQRPRKRHNYKTPEEMYYGL